MIGSFGFKFHPKPTIFHDSKGRFFIRWAALGGPKRAILEVFGGIWAVRGVALGVILRVLG